MAIFSVKGSIIWGTCFYFLVGCFSYVWWAVYLKTGLNGTYVIGLSLC